MISPTSVMGAIIPCQKPSSSCAIRPPEAVCPDSPEPATQAARATVASPRTATVNARFKGRPDSRARNSQRCAYAACYSISSSFDQPQTPRMRIRSGPSPKKAGRRHSESRAYGAELARARAMRPWVIPDAAMRLVSPLRCPVPVGSRHHPHVVAEPSMGDQESQARACPPHPFSLRSSHSPSRRRIT